MQNRALIVIGITIMYVLMRSWIFYKLDDGKEFIWWWSWFAALPATALPILICVVIILFIVKGPSLGSK